MQAYGVKKKRRASAKHARQLAVLEVGVQELDESVADIRREVDAMPEGCKRSCCDGGSERGRAMTRTKNRAVTRTQRALIEEGIQPLRQRYGSGGGLVIADPRTIRALREKGLAIIPDNAFGYDWRCKAYLTRAAYALFNAEPPAKHPFDCERPWP